MYVLFEGIDTCGKSTQIRLIAAEHPEAIITREPGGTRFGEKAREILLEAKLQSKRAELLLFLADRAEHYEEIVRPNRDKLLISDRGFLSGIGYALANGGVSLEELIALNHFALQGDWPDHIIFFETDEATLRRRLGEKSADGIEERGIDYLLTVQEKMKEALPKLAIPTLILDARESVETIHQKIVTYLGI
ncbi:dTMP kinase [Nitratifractor salsuginis]|uniref:Thymidylate kinase n=1 Tax=Nitratifractor salsuginis (strain DSM 16511 / JCM 12458 / E9I37-1) TaxID=749222 RepID=E6X364_NITSE|nr:dTMP kinase [Nitratifractor salsuginis]ADV46208.1 thymidylate kinase [Nitratifractor salsuginis DSM 16511]